MKRSPLQLEWITYPSATFEALLREHPSPGAQMSHVSARVIYQLDGRHSAELTITAADEDAAGAAYAFKIEALAGFSFSLDEALAAYKVERNKLPNVMAVNMARILYASAREYLALITSRAPHGGLVLESALIDESDVKIGSVESQAEVMSAVFGLSEAGDGEHASKKRRAAK